MSIENIINNQKLKELPFHLIPNVAKSDDDFADFLKVREFIFMKLIPGLQDDDYETCWTIDKALTEFKKILDENNIIVEENVREEFEKMKKLAIEAPNSSQSNSLPFAPEGPDSLKEMLEALYRIQLNANK